MRSEPSTLEFRSPFSYTQNTERISRLFRDRPLSPLDTAVYWLEHVIKHKGAPHLQSPAAVSPWYQYYLIDVGLILVFVFFAALCVTVLLLRTVARLICGT
jgi:glucuronosyltransferase